MDCVKSIDVCAVIAGPGELIEMSSVLISQVCEQLIVLSQIGYAVTLIASQRDKELFEESAGERMREYNVNLELVEHTHFLLNFILMATRLRKISKIQKIGMIYVRGIWGPVVLALAKPFSILPYVYDVRGAIVDEAAARGNSFASTNVVKALERWCFLKARKIVSVSTRLSKYAKSINPQIDTYNIPSCVEVSSFRFTQDEIVTIRKKWSYSENEIIFVYSGGLSHYQQIPAMLRLWEMLANDRNLRFLFLTNENSERVRTLCDGLGELNNILDIRSLTGDDYRRALAACDVSFMLRDGRELNRVASPVKFAEYIAAGLAVVVSPGTGDISDRVCSRSVGTLVDPLALAAGTASVRHLVDSIRDDRQGYRSRSWRLATEMYDWNAYRETFRKIYGEPFDQSHPRGGGYRRSERTERHPVS